MKTPPDDTVLWFKSKGVRYDVPEGDVCNAVITKPHEWLVQWNDKQFVADTVCFYGGTCITPIVTRCIHFNGKRCVRNLHSGGRCWRPTDNKSCKDFETQLGVRYAEV